MCRCAVEDPSTAINEPNQREGGWRDCTPQEWRAPAFQCAHTRLRSKSPPNLATNAAKKRDTWPKVQLVPETARVQPRAQVNKLINKEAITKEISSKCQPVRLDGGYTPLFQRTVGDY